MLVINQITTSMTPYPQTVQTIWDTHTHAQRSDCFISEEQIDYPPEGDIDQEAIDLLSQANLRVCVCKCVWMHVESSLLMESLSCWGKHGKSNPVVFNGERKETGCWHIH